MYQHGFFNGLKNLNSKSPRGTFSVYETFDDVCIFFILIKSFTFFLFSALLPSIMFLGKLKTKPKVKPETPNKATTTGFLTNHYHIFLLSILFPSPQRFYKWTKPKPKPKPKPQSNNYRPCDQTPPPHPSNSTKGLKKPIISTDQDSQRPQFQKRSNFLLTVCATLPVSAWCRWVWLSGGSRRARGSHGSCRVSRSSRAPSPAPSTSRSRGCWVGAASLLWSPCQPSL